MKGFMEVSWAPKKVKHPKLEDYVPSEEGSLKAVATSSYKMLCDGLGVCILAAELGNQHYDIFEMMNAAPAGINPPFGRFHQGKVNPDRSHDEVFLEGIRLGGKHR